MRCEIPGFDSCLQPHKLFRRSSPHCGICPRAIDYVTQKTEAEAAKRRQDVTQIEVRIPDDNTVMGLLPINKVMVVRMASGELTDHSTKSS